VGDNDCWIWDSVFGYWGRGVLLEEIGSVAEIRVSGKRGLAVNAGIYYGLRRLCARRLIGGGANAACRAVGQTHGVEQALEGRSSYG